MVQEGDFSFIKEKSMRKLLEFDYSVIEKNNLWDFLKNYHVEKTILMSRTILDNYTWYPGHSGETWELSIRTMERISKKGWDYFVTMFTV